MPDTETITRTVTVTAIEAWSIISRESRAIDNETVTHIMHRIEDLNGMWSKVSENGKVQSRYLGRRTPLGVDRWEFSFTEEIDN